MNSKVKKILAIALAAIVAVPSAVKAQEVQVADSAAWAERVAPSAVRIGSSLVINAGLTEVLKSSIHEMRPERDDNDSWPSRHMSWTTTAASIVSHELYDKSPWWVLGSHFVVDAMAMQRMLSNSHFPKDVLGGMLTGLVSTEIGYLVGDLIFPSSRRPLPSATNDFLPSVDVVTRADFPLCGGVPGGSSRTGVSTGVRATLPLSERFGVSASAGMRSLPIYIADRYVSMVDGVGLSAGVVYYQPLPWRRWAAEARFMPGFLKNFHGEGLSRPDLSFTLDLSVGASCMLTPELALGAEAGYSLWALRSEVSSLSFGVFTRALF